MSSWSSTRPTSSTRSTQAKSELAEAEQEIVKMKADARRAEGAGRRRAADGAGSTSAAPSSMRWPTSSSRRSTPRRTSCRWRRRSRRLAQLEEDVKSRAATEPGIAGRRRGEAQQGDDVDAAGAAGHRQPGAAGAARRRGFGEGKSRRRRRILLHRHGHCPSFAKAIRSCPGRPVADVIESGTMEVRAKIDENDRGNLTSGQPRDADRRRAAGRDFHGARRRAVRARRPRALVRRRQRQRGCSTSPSSSISPIRG